MEFNAEQIQELGITDDQLTKLNELIDENIADLKKDWDGKANKDAMAILDSVSSGIESMTGIKREKGQHYEDYIKLSGESYVKGIKSTLERKEKELDEKIKSGSDEMTKKELEKAQTELLQVRKDLDGYKEKAAKYDEWEAEDYKGKYEKTSGDLSAMQKRIAYNGVKPSFPDSVNKYEAKAKWDEFIKGIESKNNIEVDENDVAWAVDKENEHKRVKLESLVEKDKAIQELKQGRQITGFGNKGKQGEVTEIEGVPFKIDPSAKPAELQQALREYLSKDLKLPNTSPDYPKKFGEIWSNIKKAQQNA